MDNNTRLAQVRALYPEQINDYCRKLIAEHPALAPMYCADPRELDSAGLETDGLGETTLSPFPHLIRTYHDRALLLTTGACFSRCRFCFRKRLWRTDSPVMQEVDEAEFSDILQWLKAHPEVDDILLSGGDVALLAGGIVQAQANTQQRRCGFLVDGVGVQSACGGEALLLQLLKYESCDQIACCHTVTP